MSKLSVRYHSSTLPETKEAFGITVRQISFIHREFSTKLIIQISTRTIFLHNYTETHYGVISMDLGRDTAYSPTWQRAPRDN